MRLIEAGAHGGARPHGLGSNAPRAAARILLAAVSVESAASDTRAANCYDLIEWLMERLNIEESAEAVHLANQLCQYGYYFPVSDSKNLIVKDDSSLYRFQTPYYWPWQHRMPDNVEYAIYLAKRTLRNKQRHGLEDYELDALTSLRKNLQNKWDFITMQAEEQVRLAKERKKGDKIVSDSQERAYWRVYRPPPGYTHHLEPAPVPAWGEELSTQSAVATHASLQVDFLRSCLVRTRVKVSQALDNLVQHCTTYVEYDPLLSGVQPSNPWTTDDPAFWLLNSPLVEVPTEKRVKRWALSMEELVSDPTGLQEFTNYLRKEYSHENIRFWMAVNDLRRSAQSQIHRKVKEIFDEFLAPGAPCEINIDGKTMEKVHQELRTPTRFTFDSAAEHVYTLLLKKDCYPRFVRSEQYKALLAAGVQPLQKKRFFGFGGPAKKKSSTCNPPNVALLQQQMAAAAGGESHANNSGVRGLQGAHLANTAGSGAGLFGANRRLGRKKLSLGKLSTKWRNRSSEFCAPVLYKGCRQVGAACPLAFSRAALGGRYKPPRLGHSLVSLRRVRCGSLTETEAN
ncbi:regulator of G-protein signaling 11 [Schistocerca serialis cubense]|uniref:regulator of G-protein signaling 11 n=1 Tax=Schistocerca serialis cubense TaxID=2023355 RepID=UPI00214EFE4B|nr:regulator of G-protein signaling 11 [Schistocerca serialis cubense]